MHLRIALAFCLCSTSLLAGGLTLTVSPGLNVFNNAVGYGGIVSLDYGLFSGKSGLFVQGSGGLFQTEEGSFTTRNLFFTLGLGWRLPLGGSFYLAPALSTGLGLDRRTEGAGVSEDLSGLTTFGSVNLEYREGENLGFGLGLVPLLVNNNGFSTLSLATCVGVSLRFGGGGSALAIDVRRSGLFGGGVVDGGDALRIDLPEVSFDLGSARVTAEAREAIVGLAVRLQKYKVRRISIEGHTDDLGDPAANLVLSSRRADSVASILIANGISATMVSATGHGSGRPRYPNDSDTNRSRNRRVEITVIE